MDIFGFAIPIFTAVLVIIIAAVNETFRKYVSDFF